ncbi:MAG: hypothetical protein GX660_25885 [Clostridiaceae bacterium]|nr:hypothetical protein [Clostridiaceae bacterium]
MRKIIKLDDYLNAKKTEKIIEVIDELIAEIKEEIADYTKLKEELLRSKDDDDVLR